MDGLEALLDGPRSRGAFVLRVVMDAPWSVLVADEAPLSLVAVLRGTASCRPVGGEPVELRSGDLALVASAAPHVFADRPEAEPRVRILPGQVCVDPDGELVDASMAQGTRTWGNTAGPGDALLLIATWHETAEVSRPLLAALPPLLVRRHDEWDPAVVDLLEREAGRTDPGQSAVLDRLLDLALVALVREWAAERGAVHGLAGTDPLVGPALRLIHDRPELPWTVEAMARRANVSRATFARRFTAVVGEPAMAYVTRWRLARAADLLLATDAGLDEIAGQVGYGTPYALSTAFKRHHGVAPAVYRRRGPAAPSSEPG